MNERQRTSVLLPPALEHIDHTETLFEELVEVGKVPKDDSDVSEIDDTLAQEHSHYPLTIEQQQARIKYNLAQRAIGALYDRDSPYGELGGHPPDTLQDQIDANFESLIDDFQPWMRDIRIAFDRYGISELTTEGIAVMTDADRKVLALHMDGFLDRIGMARRLIKLADGDVRFYSQLEDWYGKSRTHDEMIDYSSRLRALAMTLDLTGVAQSLNREAFLVSSKQVNREKARRKDDKIHGHPQVVFDGTRPYIERLPHHDA